ncbi:MAG: bifunctional (p)ppGpp synthetase/guanosine-3',5'-bis(diphosphate) 3'-pyrophosphohydrolase [Planctomycetes bacterium]|nr:bifunctional (p)ppGpp synthetase/guanosine-3',5'-bis(diphosphate) 3'-pyrophosphohydrolase [Planctomycetota bacterium]
MPRPALQIVPNAIEFALLRHEGHFRKRSRVPYVVHPLRIFATLTLRLGITDEATLAAAILHDTIEDTRTDFDEISEHFGREVADLVAALTKDTRLPEIEREERFMQQVLAAPLKARIVKLADNYDNLADRIREGDAAEMRRLAREKKPHIEAICGSLPEEYRWFCDEALETLNRCLNS